MIPAPCSVKGLVAKGPHFLVGSIFLSLWVKAFEFRLECDRVGLGRMLRLGLHMSVIWERLIYLLS